MKTHLKFNILKHFKKRRWPSSALILLIISPVYGSENLSFKYTLGPQDRLSIRVYDLRKKAGEAYPWTALNGEFTVGADGFVSMPILGEVKAAGGTTANLASIIGLTLKQKADLAELPAASVEVIKYRSIYVIGAVKKPGKFEYQPGMTILQALGTAEGMLRGADALVQERDFVNAKGELETLDAERISLEAKISRLNAEITGLSELIPSSYLIKRSTDIRVIKSLRSETLLFNAKREALQSELTTIDQSKEIYKQELSTLQSKSASLDRQLDFSRKELGQINDLMSKGLSIVSRQLSAEQAQASFESNKLDNQLAKIRTQQSLSRAERDSIEVRSRFKKEALDESVSVKSKIDINEVKMRTSSILADNARLNTSSSDDALNMISFSLTRITEEGPKTRSASETDEVEPGDVLRVMQTRLEQSAADNNADDTGDGKANSGPNKSSRALDAKK